MTLLHFVSIIFSSFTIGLSYVPLLRDFFLPFCDHYPTFSRTFVSKLNLYIMALIKFSALVSGVRNSLNGSTFAVNRGGAYFRNKTTPINRRLPFQMQRRAIFGAISSTWRTLTDNQRKSWVGLAGQQPYIDIFGDQRTLSGSNFFQKLNTNLSLLDLPIIEDAPEVKSVPGVTSLLLVADTSPETMNITAVFTGLTTGTKLLVYATGNISLG